MRCGTATAKPSLSLLKGTYPSLTSMSSGSALAVVVVFDFFVVVVRDEDDESLSELLEGCSDFVVAALSFVSSFVAKKSSTPSITMTATTAPTTGARPRPPLFAGGPPAGGLAGSGPVGATVGGP